MISIKNESSSGGTHSDTTLELPAKVNHQLVVDYTETSGRFLDGPRYTMASCLSKRKYCEKSILDLGPKAFFCRLRSIEDELAIKVLLKTHGNKTTSALRRVQRNNKPQM